MSDREKIIRDILESRKTRKNDERNETIAIKDNKNSTVTIINDATITIKNVYLAPAPDSITEAQASVLRGLVESVAHIESKVSNRKNYARVWARLKQHMDVASYKCIHKDDFQKAVDYLVTMHALVKRDLNRPEKVLERRVEIYKTCHAIAKTYNAYNELRALLKREWYADSMRELDDMDLEDLMNSMRIVESSKKFD